MRDERYCTFFKKNQDLQLPPWSVDKTMDRGGRYPFDAKEVPLWQNTF
jgi:hypothetical protein